MFTIGCDPEFFCVDSYNKPVIPFFIKGTKWNPSLLPSGGSIQLDNAAVEFNTLPASSREEWIDSVISTRDECLSVVKGAGLLASTLPVMDFFELELKSEFELLHFITAGCDPSYNAYKKDVFQPVRTKLHETLRVAGGHVHVGISGLSNADKVELVKSLDEVFIPWCRSNDKLHKHRERDYGKRGSFRFKDYGIEYRVPSSFWIWNESLISEVYDMVDYVVHSN